MVENPDRIRDHPGNPWQKETGRFTTKHTNDTKGREI